LQEASVSIANDSNLVHILMVLFML